MVSARLNQFFDDRFLVAFSLHLSAYLESLHNKEYRPLTLQNTYDQIPINIQNCARDVVEYIETEYDITVHKDEVCYIALLINALRSDCSCPLISRQGLYLKLTLPADVDILAESDNPAHYADAIRYNARTPLQGSLLPLTRLV